MSHFKKIVRHLFLGNSQALLWHDSSYDNNELRDKKMKMRYTILLFISLSMFAIIGRCADYGKHKQAAPGYTIVTDGNSNLGVRFPDYIIGGKHWPGFVIDTDAHHHPLDTVQKAIDRSWEEYKYQTDGHLHAMPVAAAEPQALWHPLELAKNG
jgi:hypothetical protein